MTAMFSLMPDMKHVELGKPCNGVPEIHSPPEERRKAGLSSS